MKIPGKRGSELAKRAIKMRPDIKVMMIITAFQVDSDVMKAFPAIEQNTVFCKRPYTSLMYALQQKGI